MVIGWGRNGNERHLKIYVCIRRRKQGNKKVATFSLVPFEETADDGEVDQDGKCFVAGEAG